MDKIIYISRNPIEVPPSFAPLAITTSHSVVPEKPLNESPDMWNHFAKWMADSMSKFHNEIVE